MVRRQRFLSVVLLALFLVFAAGCSGASKTHTTTTPAASTGPTGTGHDHMHGGATPGTMQEVYIVATDVSADPTASYKFYPASVAGRQDGMANWTFKSATGNQNPHTLNIDEFNLHIGPVAAGDKSAAMVTFSKAGTFKFYCSVGNHRALGMEGTLTIS